MPYVLGALAVASVALGIFVKVASDARDAAEKGLSKATVDLEADTGVPTAKEEVIELAPPAAEPAKAT